MKLCINCEHYRSHRTDAEFDRCARDGDPKPDPVRGGYIEVARYCNIERASNAGGCGVNASYFTARVAQGQAA